MSALAVRVLGELTADGIDLTQLDRKARGLLLLLVLARGRPVPVDAAVDALWGDRPPRNPNDQVAVLASRVRRLVGRERLERTDAGYRLHTDWSDLVELEGVVHEAERRLADGENAPATAAARAALGLLRGPVPAVREEADWASAEHAAAQRLVQRARRAAATALLRAGEWHDALEIARADLVADPLDEEAARLTMQALAATGRAAQALTVHADLRALLAEELGADPSPATTALHTAILRGDLPAATPVTVGGPPALIGRDSQLAHLDSLVARASAERNPRIAVVAGEAGIGKTTLLSAWAARRRELGDTVLSGTCRPLDRSAPLDVLLTALAGHLRETGADVDADEAILVALLGSADTSRRSVDPALGPSVLYAAITRVLERIAGDRAVVVVVDDAHLAGPTLADWLTFIARRAVPVVVVLGTRPDDGAPLPATDLVGIGPFDRTHVVALVGEQRADELLARSGGHPLFLTQLADVPSGELPDSLVTAVTARCDDLGSAGDLVRTAAVLGGELDVDLLAGVLGRGTLDVLIDAEQAVRAGLLVESAGHLRFRHDLVRTALVSGTTAGRSALLHREAGRALARRPGADPAAVAEHARLGGDRELAARSLRTAATRAAERFAHATAEELLTASLALAADDETLLARAHVRIRRRRYRDAEADALAATGAGAPRWEAAAWAAYFDRRFDDAASYADDGALGAADEVARSRCLVASGRILHARGSLSQAEDRLSSALRAAEGEDRIEAAAWLGVLHAHRSEVDEALALLRPATRPGVGVSHTPASLHALLFTGHTLAVAGRAGEALACFEDYSTEVARRDVPRFAGRGVNFGGWVLRNLGDVAAGVDAHQEAADHAVDGVVIPEVLVAAQQDLADARLRAGDVEGAAGHLAAARDALVGDLVFGWRLAMKMRLLQVLLDLEAGRPEEALAGAVELRSAAVEAGVPRYDSCARLLAHRARHALGELVDPAAVLGDLTAVERAVGVEAWWWAGSTGAALGHDHLIARAEDLAAMLADASGHHREGLHAEADRRLAGWRRSASLSRR